VSARKLAGAAVASSTGCGDRRDGQEVAEIRRRVRRRQVRTLAPDRRFHVDLAPGYEPAEPLDEDEWPARLR
jgi:hypothetical protein